METVNPELFLAIFGLFGSGKTTLARGLLQSDGGANNVIVNKEIKYCVSNGGKYTFAGVYPNGSKYGGGDMIYSRDVLRIMQEVKTPIFISEGVRVQSFGVTFLRAFFSVKKQGIVYLRGSAELCCKRIKERGGGNAVSNYSKFTETEKLVKKYVDLGVDVLVVDINNSKEQILRQTLRFIDRLQK